MKAKTSVGPQAERNDPTDRARRRFLQNSAAATLVAMAAPNLLLGKPTPTAARVIKIGFVGPRTGALAHFGEGHGGGPNPTAASDRQSLRGSGLLPDHTAHRSSRLCDGARFGGRGKADCGGL